MMLPGYGALQLISHTSATDVYRAKRAKDGLRVVIKQEAPAALGKETARLRYEREVLRELNELGVPGIPRVVQLLEGDSVGYAMEDRGCISLRELSDRKVLSLDAVLHVAIRVAETLVHIHRARVTHKDINPQNIVYNFADGTVQLIDFGIASTLSHEMQVAGALTAMEGTPSYISPEQTGRLNRLLDWRTDLYSLGVTIYELLARVKPFEGATLPELVHAILAKPCKTLKEARPDIPTAVSNIVSILLSKSPEERYQSAAGLQKDLERCAEQLRSKSSIDVFPLRLEDRSERFTVQSKLYGREQQIEQLLALYAASSSAFQFAMVRGPSGIGKSALVNELQATLLSNGGFIASGKYDQLRRHIPFSAFSHAIAGLIPRLMMEDQGYVLELRDNVRKALGSVGQALIDVVPSVRELVGPQNPAVVLPPHEAEARLLTLLQRFLQSLCMTHPLVLFLDDMQWADAATLKLVKELARQGQRPKGLLLVGAYRNNEVSSGHPLLETIGDVEAEGMPVQQLDVAPLTVDQVDALVQSCTHAPRQFTTPLAKLIKAKTGGNPFFVREFLLHLRRTDLLHFDAAKNCWFWDQNRVNQVPISENVVDLVSSKLRMLPPEKVRLTTIAAVLGAEFALLDISDVVGQAPQAVADQVNEILELGIFVPLGRSYRYVFHTKDKIEDVRYRFAHDRVHQAAFEMLTPDEAAHYRHMIGMLLWAQHREEPAETWVFDVVDHLNASAALLSNDDRHRLAELNLVAGRESKRAMAYAMGLSYCETGRSLLGESGWTTHYSLCRQLLAEVADNELLSGKVEAARKSLDELLKRSASPLERAEVQRRRATAMTALSQYKEATDAAADGLRHLNFRVTRRPSKARILAKLLKVQFTLARQNIAALAQAPRINDERQALTMDLFTAYTYPAFKSDTNTFLYVVTYLTELSLRWGRSRASAMAFATFAAVLARLRKYDTAKQLSDLVRVLVRTMPHSTSPSFAHLTGTLFADHAYCKPEQVCELFEEGYNIGIDSGDPNSAGMCAALALQTAQQISVHQSGEIIERYQASLKSQGIPYNWQLFLYRRQFSACMLGETDTPYTLDSADFKQAEAPPFASNTIEAGYFGMKAWLLFVHRDLKAARQAVDSVIATDCFASMPDCTVVQIKLICALALTAEALESGKPLAHAKHVRAWLRHFDALGAAGDTYKGYAPLVRAQLAAIKGKEVKALRLYEEALQLLSDHSYRFALAAAYEMAARFALAKGYTSAARGYGERAISTYATWGAPVKVGMLQKEWAAKFVTAQAPTSPERDTLTVTGSASAQALDMPSIVRSLQSLSSEMQLSRLLVRILESMREVAGADRAVILLPTADSFEIKADTGSTHDKSGGDSINQLPERVLSYVLQTRQTIVLDNATEHEAYQADPYVSRFKPRSVSCLPIIYQGKFLALLYMENRALGGAFTEERVVAVNVLAAQAAISLENASLYATMEQAVMERTAQLTAANAKLVKLERETAEVQMAGGFAHEMRNALSGAHLLTELLLATGDEGSLSDSEKHLEGLSEILVQQPTSGALEAGRQHISYLAANLLHVDSLLRDIHSALARGLKITGLVLEYAQMGRVLPHSYTSVNVAGIIKRLLHEFQDEFANQGIETRVQVDSSFNLVMSEDHLYAILRNLLANACDAMRNQQRGTVKRSVYVKAEEESGNLVIAVEDTAGGIAEDLQKRVFEPFFSTKGAKGTGLGLGMSKKLAEIYGGTLTFKSHVGRGTTFFLSIPYNPG